MKGFFLLTLTWSIVLPHAFAYGERGAAERILYYSSYLAEQETQPDPAQRHVAPGLNNEGRPADYNEFCEHVWAPNENTQDTTRPKVSILKEGEAFEDLDVKQLIARTNDRTVTSTGKGITGASDNNKVWKGSQGYSSAIRNVGTPLADLAALPPSSDPAVNERRQKYIKQGTTAAQTLVDLRLKDMESFRIPAILKNAKGITIDDLKFTPGRDVSGRAGDYNVLDADATIAHLKAKGGDSADIFKASLTKFNKGNRNHEAALEQARKAERLTGCSSHS